MLPAGRFDARKLLGFGAVSPLHKNFGFSKSKAILGYIGPVQRARVSDLISDDPERPCGAGATRALALIGCPCLS